MASEEIKKLIISTIKDSIPSIISAAKSAANDVANTVAQASKNKIDNLKKKNEEKRSLENVEFRKKGHKRQFDHEVKVLDTINEAEEKLNEEAYEDMKEALDIKVRVLPRKESKF